MEPPTDLSADSVRDAKVNVLKSIRHWHGADEVGANVVRAQYLAGSVDGEDVVGYREEDRVAPESQTEAFVALRILIDNWRWEGVPFFVRMGKRLPKKATEISEHTGKLTLADDSGLVVDALNRAPGVHSARYAGDEATDADNNTKLLEELRDVPDESRHAAFWCVMALVDPSGSCQTFEGEVKGVILHQRQGDGGFGYDPLFMVREYGQTMAELPLDLKNRISHRGQALKKLIAVLEG